MSQRQSDVVEHDKERAGTESRGDTVVTAVTAGSEVTGVTSGTEDTAGTGDTGGIE